MSQRFIGLVVLSAVLGLAQASLAQWDPNTDPSLVGWWKLDETSGVTAVDSSTSKNNGTVAGDAAWGVGHIGGGLQCDGSNDYVDLPIGPVIQTLSSATFAAWANWSQQGGAWQRIFDIGTGTTVNMFLTPSNGSTSGMRFAITSSGNGAESQLTATARLASDWHHVAVVINGDAKTMQLYLDATVVASNTTNTLPKDLGNTNQNWLGRSQYAADGYYRGALDDFRIYSRALSAQEIRALVPPVLKATKPSPAHGATGVVVPVFSWTKGDYATSHNVYLGTTPELTAANLVAPRYLQTQYYWPVPGGLQPAVVYYWRIDEVSKDGKTIYTGDTWKFTAAPLTAFAPSPRDGDKWIATDATLSWQAGKGATQHKVYLGTDKDAVANRDAGAFQGAEVASTFEPSALELNTTYYWAIDEVTLTGDVAGALWKFTTVAAFAGGVKGEYYSGTTPSGVPQLSRIDSEINFNWGNDGPGAPIGVDTFSARWTADLEIAIADTYTFITTSDDGVRLWVNGEEVISNWTVHASSDDYSTPMTLQPGICSLVMEYYEQDGGAAAQLSWQSPNFARRIIPAGPLQPPVRARALYPHSGDANIPQDLTLMWGAGEKAVQHQIYFGEDADAVAAADTSSSLYQGAQALDQTTFTPGPLEWNKTYFWRVDEVNETAAESPWAGSVWSFTTADFLIVDDMETYNDEEDSGMRIYETWIDGYTDSLSGSTVGNIDPPFAEQTIVHGGKQSMPMDYSNIGTPHYFSQAYRDFAPLQNWTVNGLSDLVLWVRGNPTPMAPVTESGGRMTVSGEGADIWGVADQFTFVFKTLNGDGSISARVTSNGTGSNVWAKGGVMIRDDLTAGSVHAMAVITGGSGAGNGGSFQYRLAADMDAASSDLAAAIAPPYYVKVERKGDTLTASFSADGTTWAVQGEPQYIAMTAPAYIGVCVTSHAAGELRTFEFDKITTNGASGSWQTKEIGLARNTQQPLYVIVEDSSNKKATVVDPNVAAVNATQWTEWKIPLTDLTGISLNKVKRLYIGVGDPQSTSAGGAGRVYIDDIRVMKPAGQ